MLVVGGWGGEGGILCSFSLNLALDVYGDHLKHLQEMFDDADTAIPNTPIVNASFELVHTGAGGDGARFNLPSDTAHPAAGS